MKPRGVVSVPFYQPLRTRRASSISTAYAATLTLVVPAVVSRLITDGLAGTAAHEVQTCEAVILAASQVTKNILVVAGEGAAKV